MKDYLELLSSVGKLKKFQKNSILFYEGEEAKKFFILPIRILSTMSSKNQCCKKNHTCHNNRM